MERSISILKGQPFQVGGRQIVLKEDREIFLDDPRGYFILDMWNPCDISDINVFPAAYVMAGTYQEQYELLAYNVVLGSVKELCLD